jgi:hypothetical protein
MVLFVGSYFSLTQPGQAGTKKEKAHAKTRSRKGSQRKRQNNSRQNDFGQNYWLRPSM